MVPRRPVAGSSRTIQYRSGAKAFSFLSNWRFKVNDQQKIEQFSGVREVRTALGTGLGTPYL